MSDLFTVLGIDRTCTTKDVKKAFLSKALIWHPDRANLEDKERYAEKYALLQQAYKTLSNDESRKQYSNALVNTIDDLREVDRNTGYITTNEFTKLNDNGGRVFDNKAFLTSFVDKTDDAVNTTVTETSVTKNDLDSFLKQRELDTFTISTPKLGDSLNDPSSFNNAFNNAFNKMKKDTQQQELEEYSDPLAHNNLTGLTELDSHSQLLTHGSSVSSDQMIKGVFDNPETIDLTNMDSKINHETVEKPITKEQLNSRMDEIMADRDRLLDPKKVEFKNEPTEIEKEYSELFKAVNTPISGEIGPSNVSATGESVVEAEESVVEAEESVVEAEESVVEAEESVVEAEESVVEAEPSVVEVNSAIESVVLLVCPASVK
jgi:curved DNA-binding protein CbpA